MGDGGRRSGKQQVKKDKTFMIKKNDYIQRFVQNLFAYMKNNIKKTKYKQREKLLRHTQMIKKVGIPTPLRV